LLLVMVGGSMVLGSFGRPGEPRLSRSERRAARAERHRDGAPVIWFFIAFAILMSLQGRLRPRDVRSGQGVTRTTEAGDTVHRSAVLGENRTISHSSRFRGGDLTAIMGNCQLDLTDASVAPDEIPVVNVFVLMGNVTLRVPDDWIVDNGVAPALGDVRDSRTGNVNRPASGAAAPAATERPHIMLRGVVTMGDLVIKN
jgi:hypothetical protein